MKQLIKNKITTRIFVFFSLSIIFFSSVVGSIFLYLYSKNTIATYRSDFISKTEAIANTLSLYFENEFPKDSLLENQLNNKFKQANLGLGLYLNFMDDIPLSNIWLVDSATQTIHVEFGKYNISYSSIPTDVRALIDTATEGTTAVSERWANSFLTKNFVIASPIKFSDGTVFATVVIHARSKTMSNKILEACYVLIGSLSLALLASLLPSYLFARMLVNPLKKMAHTTGKMTLGDYTAQTGVKQNDEVGMLARNIDILANRLDEASKEHLQLEQLRKTYISNISHELRTPVAVMRCSLEALCDGIVTSKDSVCNYHHEMLNEIIHLDRIVNDLLELSRLQSPSYSIEKQKINFISVVEDAIKTASHLSEKSGHPIILNTNMSLFVIYGDFGRLRQMLVTVLHNAIKFSSPQAPIEVDVTISETYCLTTITNSGAGISQQDLPHIFEEYYTQIGECNPTGTGLGLPIAKKIADRHNIHIFVNSIPNEKTSFSFEIFNHL